MPARIVLIEDDPATRSSLAQALTNAGHTVLTAYNGEVGLELIAQDPPPDLILSDLSLGFRRLTGFSVAMRCRQDPRTAERPLLAITHTYRKMPTRMMTAAGFNAVIHKPIVDEEAFVREVEAYLPLEKRTYSSVKP